MTRLLGSLTATILLVLSACSDGSEYLLMEKRELARGVRYDSLFLGLHFGMDRKDFFDHCYNLNKEGMVKEGPGGASVEYVLTDMPHPARMNFYPDFDEDNRIYKVPVSFHYDAWAPWNKAQWSDSLLPAVVTLLEHWYGEGFIKIEPENAEYKSVVFAKVDGNRRIAVFKESDMKVKAIFTDLNSSELEKKKGKERKAIQD